MDRNKRKKTNNSEKNSENVEKIEELWTTPSFPTSYTSLSGFMNNSKFQNAKQVQDHLSKINSYSLHKGPVRKHFKRRKIICMKSFETFCIDTGFMTKFAYYQGKPRVSYFLVAICCFSQYMFCEVRVLHFVTH